MLERGWRQRAEAAERALQQAHEDMADIKADIARQHVMSQVGWLVGHAQACWACARAPHKRASADHS